jgi:hypothetical protein
LGILDDVSDRYLAPKHLLLAWGVYWVGLVLSVVGPAIPALWRVTRPDAHGSASASIRDGVLTLMVADGSSTVWTRAIGLATIAISVAAPPLVLWAFWLRSQRNRRPPVAGERAV